LNYAKVARDAGFKSRSLAREVLMGKKRLTPKTWRAFLEALRLPKELETYFEYLVAQTHSDCRVSEATFNRQKKSISKLKERIVDKYGFSENGISFSDASVHWPTLYAALGSVGRRGVTVQEIVEKTRLERSIVEKEMLELKRRTVVLEHNKRFMATRDHLSFTGDQGKEYLKNLFLWQSQNAMSAVRSNEQSAQMLFLASTFSVRKKDLQELKKKLQETVLLFIDQAEDVEGDAVTRLTVSLV
jgi:hypothetical protein